MEASWLRATQHKTGFAVTYAYPIPSTSVFTDDFINAGVDGLISDLDTLLQVWPLTLIDLGQMLSRLNNDFNQDLYLATAKDNPWKTRHPGYGLRIHTAKRIKSGTDNKLKFKLTGTCGSSEWTVNTDPRVVFGSDLLFESGDQNFVTIPSRNIGQLVSLSLSSNGIDSWYPDKIDISSASFGIPINQVIVDYGRELVDRNHTVTKSLPRFGYDCAPPTASIDPAPRPNVYGWNNDNVTVYWNWFPNSGAALDTVTSCPAFTASTGTGIIPVSATCADEAGNVATVNHVVRVDKTPPTAVCGVADGLWRATDVSISCVPSDALSGLVSTLPFSLRTSVPNLTETSNALTNQSEFLDKAFNASFAGPIGGNKVDKKAPVITNQPAAAEYANSDTLNYTVTDGGSGVGSVTVAINGGAPVAASSLSGGAISLTSLPLGTNTVLISSTDNVGNKSSLPVTITIVVATPTSIIYDVNRLVASGAITGDPAPLLAPLNAAVTLKAAGNCPGAVTQWGSFIQLVNAGISTTPGTITQAAAAILIRDAQYLLGACGYGG